MKWRESVATLSSLPPSLHRTLEEFPFYFFPLLLLQMVTAAASALGKGERRRWGKRAFFSFPHHLIPLYKQLSLFSLSSAALPSDARKEEPFSSTPPQLGGSLTPPPSLSSPS